MFLQKAEFQAFSLMVDYQPRSFDAAALRLHGRGELSSIVFLFAGNNMFLQKAEIQAFSLMVDYQPRSLDAAALRSGSFVEVLNLIPWGGVQLELPVVKASGLQGWDALGSAVGNAYLEDIASSQVNSLTFLLRCVVTVGCNTKQLVHRGCKNSSEDLDQGWDALGSALGSAYLEDMASAQVNCSFLPCDM